MDFDKKGLFNYEYVTRDGLAIDCWIYYEEGEPQTWDEPGEPETVELHHACVGGVDVIEIMDQEIISMIEEKAVKAMMEAYGD